MNLYREMEGGPSVGGQGGQTVKEEKAYLRACCKSLVAFRAGVPETANENFRGMRLTISLPEPKTPRFSTSAPSSCFTDDRSENARQD
jgi:hypothetical protein